MDVGGGRGPVTLQPYHPPPVIGRRGQAPLLGDHPDQRIIAERPLNVNNYPKEAQWREETTSSLALLQAGPYRGQKVSDRFCGAGRHAEEEKVEEAADAHSSILGLATERPLLLSLPLCHLPVGSGGGDGRAAASGAAMHCTAFHIGVAGRMWTVRSAPTKTSS